jgi:IS5 family transposase
MVIATAYLHAINYTQYGEDVTEKWVTAIQNTSALEKAYRKGYYDALQRRTESEDVENYYIKMVTNAKDAEKYPISEDISKGIEEINKMIFENGQVESEE